MGNYLSRDFASIFYQIIGVIEMKTTYELLFKWFKLFSITYIGYVIFVYFQVENAAESNQIWTERNKNGDDRGSYELHS